MPSSGTVKVPSTASYSKRLRKYGTCDFQLTIRFPLIPPERTITDVL